MFKFLARKTLGISKDEKSKDDEVKQRQPLVEIISADGSVSNIYNNNQPITIHISNTYINGENIAFMKERF